MAKKLTLEQTWTLCLQMWKWIVEQVQKDPDVNVDDLKEKWLEKHGWEDDDELEGNCFFCEWGNQQGDPSCDSCPAKRIDKTFDCRTDNYHFIYRPIDFYQEVVALNKIRKARKPNAKNLQK